MLKRKYFVAVFFAAVCLFILSACEEDKDFLDGEWKISACVHHQCDNMSADGRMGCRKSYRWSENGAVLP